MKGWKLPVAGDVARMVQLIAIGQATPLLA
jgi:hypothetical protein